MKQGDPALLSDPLAQRLLKSQIPARLAYTWGDGTPRVVPMLFHWDGNDVVLSTPTNAPKLKVIRDGAIVALTIDEVSLPPGVLLIRGAASVDVVDGLTEESIAAAYRYMGDAGGQAWVEQMTGRMQQTARIKVRPAWVGLYDFKTRFPSSASP